MIELLTDKIFRKSNFLLWFIDGNKKNHWVKIQEKIKIKCKFLR